ncbi:MAG: hypothetical protein LBP70_00480 [Mycoplasmataceae bacterium]|jgi:hypothetical protein|nr:hypothetical protein [Mycoplasmataceae bacterium]
MGKVKLSIEIDSEVYSAIKKQYEEMSQMLSSKMNVKNVDEYIENILVTCAKSGEQIKNLGSKLNDIFEKFGGFDAFGNIDLDSILKPRSETKKEEKPKTSTNLKN